MSWLMRPGLPDDMVPMPSQVPGPVEQAMAAGTQQYIAADSFNRELRFSRELRSEIVERLGDQAPNWSLVMGERSAAGYEDPEIRYTRRVIQSAMAQAEADPGSWAGVPITEDEFQAEIQRRREAEHTEVSEIMRRGPNPGAQLIGGMIGAMTDEVSLATMPLGFGFARGGWQAGRFILGEMAIGAASEAAMLPRMARVAEDLDLPPPNAALQLSFGAAGAGAISGGMVGAGRFIQYLRGARIATRESLPAGTDTLDAAAQISAAEVDLRVGRAAMTPTERFATERDSLPLQAPSLLATTGSDGAMRAMIRLPDGTRLTNLDVGTTLPDGSRIAAIEAGSVRIERDGESYSVEVGEALGPATPAMTRQMEPTADQPMIDERPGSPAGRFVFTPGGNAAPAENPVGYVYGRLIEFGYPPHIVSGLVGNLMQESTPSLNTRMVGDGQNSYGMGQWNGPRRVALYNWAQARGLDVNDIETQVQFLHYELQGPENPALRAILQAPDAETAARIASERFWRPGDPRVENRMGYAVDLQRQFDDGEVPIGGRPVPPVSIPAQARFFGDGAEDVFGGGRRSTAWDEVSSPQGTRVGVEWEVVELSSLRAASGELQPRDRGRAASDEQIASIAADLDPVRLLPSPEADRGAPIVGPDGVVESGNGRIAAVRRAAEQHPERYRDYVTTLRQQGYDIPEGMRQPVLVGRRTSDLTPEGRVAWVRENNTSAIARMSAPEQARMDASYLTQPVMDALRPRASLASDENGEFIRRLFAEMPQTERAALVSQDGALTLDGLRRARSALFARAWGDEQLLKLLMEQPSDELRALVAMLEDVAPEWAAFRGMVEGGYINPDFDVTRAITDMVRLIGETRAADRDGQSVIAALRDYLDTPDMLNPRDPAMNEALLATFYKGGKARQPGVSGDILRRYASDAAIAGRADVDDLFGKPPTPAEVLASSIVAQERKDALPAPLEAPARAAPDPVTMEDAPTLPEAADGATSADLEALARATEDEARAALDATPEPAAGSRADASRETQSAAGADAMAKPQAPARRRPRSSTKKAQAEEMAAMRAHFEPGAVIRGFGDQYDRVLEFVEEADGGWRVRVEAVRREDDVWVRSGPVRTHSTRPTARELAAGPVKRGTPTSARDEVAIDGADYVALRDAVFKMGPDEDSPTLSFREILDTLNADAALEDAIRTCSIGGPR